MLYSNEYVRSIKSQENSASYSALKQSNRVLCRYLYDYSQQTSLYRHRAARGTTRSARDPSAADGLRTLLRMTSFLLAGDAAPAPCFASVASATYFYKQKC